MVTRALGAGKAKARAAPKKKAGTAPLKKRAADADGGVAGFLQDLDVEIESRCALLEFDGLRRADELRNAFSNELIKLPKSIRAMPVREFVDKYGGDLSLVLEQDRQKVLQATGFASGSLQGPRTPGAVELRSAKAISRALSMRRTQAAPSVGRTGAPPSAQLSLRGKAMLSSAAKPAFFVSGTPSRGAVPASPAAQLVFGTPHNARAGMPPPTPATLLALNNKKARTLRRGESIMSINGSPLVGEMVDPLASTIALAIGDPSRLAQDMAAKDKDQAFSELEALKDQVASLMDKIKASK
jgi:hypothetical protein